jgi:hypothetical protein
MLLWLTQRMFSGISARKNALASRGLLVMLSSTKKNSLRAEIGAYAPISSMISSVGLRVCVASKTFVTGAELALEVAAASCLDQAYGQVSLCGGISRRFGAQAAKVWGAPRSAR